LNMVVLPLLGLPVSAILMGIPPAFYLSISKSNKSYLLLTDG